MRYIRYPRRGRPSDTRSNNFDELLLITLAALSIANTERRLAEYFLRKNESIPNHIESKKEAYEVSVVENFYKLGQQNFALHGSIPIWERRINIPAGQNTTSENFSIDISLFHPIRREESRIEFGFYKKDKLKSDTNKLIKLHNLKDSGFENINNFIILWTEDKRPPKQNKYTDEENKNKSLKNSTDLWFDKFKKMSKI
ncbi:MAG: hypothetical protein Q4D78_05205 [Neisseria zoodegmatis]|uniref:hypothetical protein n=1 Tax=Neisseria zoodegmatis TaxID=326523 RepID=UPI0026EB56A2|nr:hypothetical protein [Neisseria zoodegmatis]MDO5069586.1 hypothetical protein [Neisseria zoodegmatis]